MSNVNMDGINMFKLSKSPMDTSLECGHKNFYDSYMKINRSNTKQYELTRSKENSSK